MSAAPFTPSRTSFTMNSSLDSVQKLEQTAEQYAQRAGFDSDTVVNITIAAREAAVNAVLHGNQYSASKMVTAAFEMSERALTIRIADQGAGMPSTAIPDPLAAENLMRSSGRGVFLMRTFMDEVHFRQLQPGNEVTLVKYRGAVTPPLP